MLQGTLPQEIKNCMAWFVRCVPVCSQPAQKAVLPALLLSIPAPVLSTRVLKNTTPRAASYNKIDQCLSKEWCCSCEHRGVSTKWKCSFCEGSIHADNLKAKRKFSLCCRYAYVWEAVRVVSSIWGKINRFFDSLIWGFFWQPDRFSSWVYWTFAWHSKGRNKWVRKGANGWVAA